MARPLNKFNGIGFVATDIVLRKATNGDNYCKFELKIYQVDDDNPDKVIKDNPDYVPASIWKENAETFARYYSNGDEIEIEGRLRKKRKPDGTYCTEVECSYVKLHSKAKK